MELLSSGTPFDGPGVRYSPRVQVHFCGVRGSAPAPGGDFIDIGGSTSCVAIAEDGDVPSLILDAGTGLRNIAKLMRGAPFRGTIVLGHLHWDHIMGLPFFPSGDRLDAKVHLLMPEQGFDPVEILGRMMGPPLFPITPTDLLGEWTFDTYGDGQVDIGSFSVLARDIPHKGGRTMGLRVSDGRSSIAYLSDHAPHDLGPGADGLGAMHPAAVELATGVDLLIHDSQYTTDELPARAGWGHAAAQYGATLGAQCGVKRVLMYHHDPSRTDDQVRSLHAELAGSNDIDIDIAVEGLTIRL